MGPRPFSRGNTGFCSPAARSRFKLQWGRGLSAAEIALKDGVKAAGKMLQWGRGLSAAEMVRWEPGEQREV